MVNKFVQISGRMVNVEWGARAYREVMEPWNTGKSLPGWNISRNGDVNRMMNIMVFIPAYNCSKQLPRVLGQFSDAVLTKVQEIVVINNRSTDETEQVAVAYGKSHPTLPLTVLRNKENYGLGGSHKVAFNYAMEHGYDYVIVLHGDDQGSIDNLLPYLDSGEYADYDCFLGARFMRGSKLQGYSTFRTFGNRVYNFLFTLGTGKWIADLGSGLNMYRVDALRSGYYLKYKDNLVFNYCMIMGETYLKQRIRFFPILWREDDQVSNVKMVNQAITVLQLLGSYVMNKKKFAEEEHRDRLVAAYEADVVTTNIKS